MVQIKRWDTEEIIHEFEGTIKEATEDAVKNKISLVYADLKGANLVDANLQGANLAGANLQGANLEYADLRRANFKGADLSDAILAGAFLRDANLEYAKLQGADLESADLVGVDLQSTDLEGANLEGTNINHDTFIKDTTENIVEDEDEEKPVIDKKTKVYMIVLEALGDIIDVLKK